MSRVISTSTNPAILPDSTPTLISDTAWYITEFRMNVEYLPKAIRTHKTSTKIRLYVTRTFEIDCQIDKKVVPPHLSINTLLRRLHIVCANGLTKTFRWPKLDPIPTGASADPTLNLSNTNNDWKVSSYAWFYDSDKQKYITIATVTGSWKEWAYLGEGWVDSYSET